MIKALTWFMVLMYHLCGNQCAEPDAPRIEVIPHSVLFKGETATIVCTCRFEKARFHLNYNNKQINYTDSSDGCRAEFKIPYITREKEGNYSCDYYTSENKYQSPVSDSVQVIVKEQFPKPVIMVKPGNAVVKGENVTIECERKHTAQNCTFILCLNDQEKQQQKVSAGHQKAEFQISHVRPEDQGNYTCHYYAFHPTVWSERSEPVHITLKESTPGGSGGEGGGLPLKMVISIACVAVLLIITLVLVVLLAFKRSQKKQKLDVRTPINDSMPKASTDQTYETATREDQNYATGAPCQKEEDEDQGITYATLNAKSLKQKSGSSQVPEENTLYAAVVVK